MGMTSLEIASLPLARAGDFGQDLRALLL